MDSRKRLLENENTHTQKLRTKTNIVSAAKQFTLNAVNEIFVTQGSLLLPQQTCPDQFRFHSEDLKDATYYELHTRSQKVDILCSPLCAGCFVRIHSGELSGNMRRAALPKHSSDGNRSPNDREQGFIIYHITVADSGGGPRGPGPPSGK